MRTIHKLSDAAVRSETKPGRLSDGGGLYLRIAAGGSRTWAFMFTWDGKRTEMSLGSYPAVSLAKARQRAKECRELLADKRNPKAERDREAEPTFAETVDRYLAINGASWTVPTVKQWRRQLGDRYCKALQGKRISQITSMDVQAVLTPIWNERQRTAALLRQRLEAVIDFASVQGWRDGANPARWKGHLQAVYPRHRKPVVHRKAIDYENAPEVFAYLATVPDMSARALQFQILTATRPGEAAGASWSEIDMDKALWRIPASRMKRSREHVVPLAPQALDILRPLFEAKLSHYVFPGAAPRQPIGRKALNQLLVRHGIDATAHGWRSTFRDYSGDQTNFAREVCEGALSHLVGDGTERAYRRRDAIEKRAALLQVWADYCTGQAASNVVPIGRVAL